ncbi:MAG: ATP-binding protein [Gemmatimonadota bacterium]
MERRNRIRTKLIVTFIALVTGLIVLSAMIWYRVATQHVRREMENRLQAVAQAGGIVLNDPGLIQAVVADLGPNTRAIAQEELQRIRDRFGVDAAYIFDRELRIRATTDTTRMDVGSVYPALENYAPEIERALAGEAVITVPFRDPEGNVYQTAMAPLIGFVDPQGARREVVAVLGVDLPVEFLDVFNDFRRMTILLTAVAIGLTILVGFLFARSLSRPIGELVRSAERMERGEMSEQVRVDSRDEIGYLGDAMENMRRGIVRRDRHLRTMLAGVAHEIRNPLGGIEIFAGLLRDDLPEQDGRRGHLDKIIREVQNLKTIVNEFLVYARPRRPVLEPFVLREALDDISFLLAGEGQAREVRIEVELADDDLRVYADVDQIKRALVNLVKNAIQASPKGGRVEIEAHEASERIRIVIRDYGPGIPSDRIKQIFDPFFTTKGAGAGLGLSIVRSIIEENEGEIWVESVPGEKTIFFVVLPAASAAASRFRAAEPSAAVGG